MQHIFLDAVSVVTKSMELQLSCKGVLTQMLSRNLKVTCEVK
jgi:hypothetical protein